MPEIKPAQPNSIIDAQESLIRLIYSPDHVTENGELKPTFITSSDMNDPIKHPEKGLSVERGLYVKKEYLLQHIQDFKAKNPLRSLHGFALIKCQSVLDIQDHEHNGAFNVRAAPTNSSEAHALIACTVKYSKSIFNMVRERLTNKFRIVKTLEEALE